MTLILSKDAIDHAVADLVGNLKSEVTDEWVVIGILNGGLLFAADVMRALYQSGINPVFDTVCLSSYGDARQSAGEVRCDKDIKVNLKNRNILLLDDVYESGRTLSFACEHLKTKGAARIVSAVVARKPYLSPHGNPPNYVLWEAPDEFLIGYGLDDKGRFRGQPFISSVDD